MSIANIAASAIERMLGALLWRVLIALLTAIFALIALYHFTVAGRLALELQFGAPYAHIIIGGIYIALTLAGAGALWVMGWIMGRKPQPPASAPPSTRAMQLAALIEAVMLGYTAARKGDKSS